MALPAGSAAPPPADTPPADTPAAAVVVDEGFTQDTRDAFEQYLEGNEGKHKVLFSTGKAASFKYWLKNPTEMPQGDKGMLFGFRCAFNLKPNPVQVRTKTDGIINGRSA